MNWYNKSNNVTTYPASFLATSATYYCGTGTATAAPCTTTWATKVQTGAAEDYRPTCQIFTSTSATTGSSSQCMTTATPTNSTCVVAGNTIANDDADQNDPLGGSATIRCWNVPGGCAYVPAGLTCTTSTRARKKTSSTSVSQPYTVITFPNVSASGTTEVPPNYMWWMMQQIYKGNTAIQLYMNTDRNGAAKTAITDLVNSINVTGLPDKVKFGLARYDSGSNGGYVLVPPATGNKAALLAAVAAIPASGGTPLSETLVDVARYLAGADKLGTYPQYNRSTSGATVSAASAPQSPITSSCEKLFIIAVTDGLPTSDCNDHYGTNFTSTFGSYNDGDPTPCTDVPPNGYLDDVSAYLYAHDLRSSLSGNQNVITYTVGLHGRLAAAAARGRPR